MTFQFVDAVAFSRAVFYSSLLSLAACSSPTLTMPEPGQEPEAFSMSERARRSHFPKVQNIGVVELSGSRIQARPFKKANDEQEYLATGGALLVKRLESPIYAQAPEILVTPDAAEVLGKSVVKKDGRLIIGESDETKIVIDGTQVKVEGPHSIREISSGVTKSVVSAPKPEEAPVKVKAEPAPKVVAAPKPSAKPEVKKVVKATPPPAVPAAAPIKKAAEAPVKKPAAEAPVVKAPVAKPEVKPVAKSAVKPEPKPVAKPEPKPVDREKLRGLMREPSDF